MYSSCLTSSSVQVQYREEVGQGTPVMDTPEMERVRRNQENISSVSTAIYDGSGGTPEIRQTIK